MDTGLRFAAAVAMALLLLGLLALAVTDPYEGPLVWSVDSQHSVRALDLVGGLIIAGATSLAWGVALAWQHRNSTAAHATSRVALLEHVDYQERTTREWNGGRSG